MINYNKKILESFINQEQKENEVSLEELVKYRLWQCKNLIETVVTIRELFQEEFNKLLSAGFNVRKENVNFGFGTKDYSGKEEYNHFIQQENISLSLTCDVEYQKIKDFFDNKNFIQKLYDSVTQINNLNNTIFNTYDTNKQYVLYYKIDRLYLAYNHFAEDFAETRLNNITTLFYNSPLRFGVDYLNPSKNNMKVDELSYYFNRSAFIQNLMLKSKLEKGIYKGEIINPFKAIMFDENNIPSDIVEHIKEKRLIRKNNK